LVIIDVEYELIFGTAGIVVAGEYRLATLIGLIAV